MFIEISSHTILFYATIYQSAFSINHSNRILPSPTIPRPTYKSYTFRRPPHKLTLNSNHSTKYTLEALSAKENPNGWPKEQHRIHTYKHSRTHLVATKKKIYIVSPKRMREKKRTCDSSSLARPPNQNDPCYTLMKIKSAQHHYRFPL